MRVATNTAATFILDLLKRVEGPVPEQRIYRALKMDRFRHDEIRDALDVLHEHNEIKWYQEKGYVLA